MSEPNNKKPTEGKKPTSEKTDKTESNKTIRDKNGRFTSEKKSDDGTVKINVVKDMNPNAKKKDTKSEDKEPQGNTVHIIGIPLRLFRSRPVFSGIFDTDWMDKMAQDMDRTFDSFSTMFAPLEKRMNDFNGDSLKSFIREVDAKKPQTITINGRTYYSEEDVSAKVAKTIATCAEVASKEMANSENSQKLEDPPCKADASGEESLPKEHQISPASQRKALISEKMAKIMANVIMWTVVAGIAASSVFGIVSLIRILTR